jgi:hypothetical protein
MLIESNALSHKSAAGNAEHHDADFTYEKQTFPRDHSGLDECIGDLARSEKHSCSRFAEAVNQKITSG